MRWRNPNTGLVIFWVKLMQRGYKRSIFSLYRVLKRLGALPVKPLNPKYVPKPYEQMRHPGQLVQIDVKFVPSSYLFNKASGQKFYQYTAIDEYSRWRYVEAFDEHSTYSFAVFLEHLIKAFSLSIECVQTDNGSEFTKRFFAKSEKGFFTISYAIRASCHKKGNKNLTSHNSCCLFLSLNKLLFSGSL